MKKTVSFALALAALAFLLAGCGNTGRDAAPQAGQAQTDGPAAAATAAADAGTDPGAETAGVRYVIRVRDAENGGPVGDVTVQFCSDTECRMGRTDENGDAEFGAEPGSYTAHVLKVPEGYEKNDEEIGLTADGPVATFLLTKSGGTPGD